VQDLQHLLINHELISLGGVVRPLDLVHELVDLAPLWSRHEDGSELIALHVVLSLRIDLVLCQLQEIGLVVQELVAKLHAESPQIGRVLVGVEQAGFELLEVLSDGPRLGLVLHDDGLALAGLRHSHSREVLDQVAFFDVFLDGLNQVLVRLGPSPLLPSDEQLAV